jgi:hypothetical protein
VRIDEHSLRSDSRGLDEIAVRQQDVLYEEPRVERMVHLALELHHFSMESERRERLRGSGGTCDCFVLIGVVTHASERRMVNDVI